MVDDVTILRRWLWCIMALVVLMIALGGATRLTNSGLSITEWRPVSGVLPPLSASQWQTEFEKYQQFPEFMAEHADMDMSAFKFIYFMEWSHRQLGRLIGMGYILPLIWFLWCQRIRALHRGRFLLIAGLITLQGAIGWWMVSSGLEPDRVDVAPVRLAVHLSLAFLILGEIFWLWRGMKPHSFDMLQALDRRVYLSAVIFLVLLYMQIFTGALVAGTHAGKVYNSWPLMGDSFLPQTYVVLSPFWHNLIENPAAIQFNHRLLAYGIMGMSAYIFYLGRYADVRLQRHCTRLACVVGAQFLLGIWTLLTAAPLPLAWAHQILAIIVFFSGLQLWFEVRSVRKLSAIENRGK